MKVYTNHSVYRFLAMSLILLCCYSTNLHSQIANPCYANPNCTSEDFDLLNAYLANDPDGTPLQAGDCDNPPVNAFICMEIENNTNSSRDGIYIEGEFQSGPNIEILGYCFDTLMPPNMPVILCAPAPANFVWQCNSEVALNQYIMVFATASQALCPGDTINCSATTPAKCRIEIDSIIQVQIPIVVQFDWACASASNTVDFIDLTIGGTGDYTYNWDFGDGSSSTEPMPTHTYPSVGIYQVILEVTDSIGESDADTLLVDLSLCCDLVVTCPVDTSFNCGEVPIDIFLGSGGTIDNQCGNVSIASDFVDPGICGGTVGVIFTITDDNNTPGEPLDDFIETCEATYTINPAPPPIFNPIVDITITCESAPPVGTIINYGNGEIGDCEIQGSALGVISGTYDACGGVFTETWTYTDACNSVETSRIITVLPAEIDDSGLLCPNYAPVTCSEALTLTINDYTPIVINNGGTGNCFLEITATPTDVNTIGVTCDGTGMVIVTYAVTDNCSGSYADLICVQSVLPAELPIAPECPNYPNVTCAEAINLTTADYQDILSSNGLVGACNVTITASASDVDVSNVSCDGIGIVVVSYSVTDNCGGTYSNLICVQSVDPAPAASTPICPAYPAVSCEEALSLTVADYPNLVSDNGLIGACNISITAIASNVDVSNVSCDGIGSVIVTYTVTDNCSGMYNDLVCNQTVNAAAQPVAPVCPVYNSVTCADAINLTTTDYPNITNTNGLVGVCNITITATSTNVDFSGVSCDGTGIVIITYAVSDNCGGMYADLVCNQSVDAVTVPTIPVCPVYQSITCEEALNLTTQDYPNITSTNGLIGACNVTITASASIVDISNVACDGSGGVIITYTVTDNCGGEYNDLVCNQPVDAVPVPNVPVCPTYITITCDDAINLTVADYPDVTSGNGLLGACNITITATASIIDNSTVACDGSGDVIITYSVTDNCGGVYNDLVCFQAVEPVVHASEPVCPMYASVTCEAALNMTVANYSNITTTNGLLGICNITITAIASNVDAGGVSCDGTGVVVISYSVTDNCGGTYEDLVCTQSVNAAPQPVEPICPVFPSISCEAAVNVTTADYSDLISSNGLMGICNITITASAIDVDVSGVACDGTEAVIITYSVTDNCGGIYADLICNQPVDAVPQPSQPVCPTYASITCDEALNLTTADYPDIITDNGLVGGCNVTITASSTMVDISGVTCDGTGDVFITYTVTDNCGGSYIDLVCNQTVEAAPVPVSFICPNYAPVSCTEALQLTTGFYSDIFTDNGLSGACFIEITASATSVDVSSVSCDGTGVVVVTYALTDNCGGTYADLICSQTVNAAEAPVFENVPGDITIQCLDTLPVGSTITYTNGLTGACLIEGSANGIITGVPEGCGDFYTESWTVADACGYLLNTSRTITIVDTIGPVLVPGTNEIVECDGQGNAAEFEVWLANNGGATATDNCSEIVWTNVIDGFVPDCGSTGTYAVTFNATDICGNVSSFQGTFTIVDTTDPEIEFVDPDLLNFEDGDIWTIQCYGQEEEWNIPILNAMDAAASDSCDGNITVTMVQNELPDGDCTMDGYIKGYEYVWTAQDACLNESTLTLTINIVDTIPPQIIGVPDDMTAECGAVPDPPFIYAVDECMCSTLEFEEILSYQGCVDGNILTRVWTATDCCGNVTVEVQEIELYDNTAPQVVVTLPNGAIIDEDTVLSFDCAEGIPFEYLNMNESIGFANDACTGNTPIFFTSMNTGENCDVGAINSYDYVWKAIDECGNMESVTVTLLAIDNEPPYIESFDEVVCFDEDIFNFTVLDACNDNLFITYTEEEFEDECGEYTMRHFVVTDPCGNALELEQKILPEDLTSPTFEVFDADLVGVGNLDTITLACEGLSGTMTGFNESSIVFSDECIESMTTEFSEELIDDMNCVNEGALGLWEVSWSAIDMCGNSASFTVLVYLIDEEAPVFDFYIPEFEMSCDQELPELTADDLCGISDIVTIQDTIPGLCPVKYSIVRSVTVSDECGNSALAEQTIHIVDYEGPEMDIESFVCDDFEIPEVLAYDECEPDPIVAQLIQEDTIVNQNCPNRLIVKRTWMAVDECGNETIEMQIVAEPSDEPAIISYEGNIQDYIGIETIVTTSNEELTAFVEALNKYSIVANDPCLNIPFESSFTLDIEEGDCITQGYYEKRTYTWYLTIPCNDDVVQTAVFYMTDDIAPLPPIDDEFYDLGCNVAPDYESMPFPYPELIIDPEDVEVSKKINVEDELGQTVVTVTWILEDNCGNTSTFTRTYFMINESGLTCDIDSPESIYCNSHGNILIGLPSSGEAPFEYEWVIEGKQCFIQSGQNTDSLEIYVGFWDVYVKLTITDANGCSTICEMTIDCIPDFENRATSGNQFYMSNVSPNPAHTDISYNIGADNDMSITETVYDINGRALMNKERMIQKGVNDIQLNIANLQSGVYILKVANEESSLQRRFIKID